MSNIEVSIVINCSTSELWDYLKNIEDHVEWMADAYSIDFTSSQKSGEGTTFDCLTKIGPIKLNDKMTITEWVDEERMGVKHSGIVTGSGVFTIEKISDQETFFSWQESLKFPWYMGGPVGALISKPILTWVWKRNLKELRKKFA